ncbi:hypothetical protein RCO27_02585 [Sphingosinicella sp. LHD-64]|uniref:hypothetical protein n=1 Tax=Sphingosinicella sp. LHD-64 TaxID=3072139 RepID=UPI00280E0F24|nr:hypothetical protein [Sphingosinicella sp. LHD-64]MDQ8755106.1 hypothetical protein [Sphingosinicella sp. LHD-64]
MGLLKALAGLAALISATAAGAAPEHYDLEARIDPTAGTISARLIIDLPVEQALAESRYVVGERFRIVAADAGPDTSTEIGPATAPFPGLQAVTIRTRTGRPPPRRITIRWEGPLNPPQSGSPVVAASPDRVELFIDSMWLPFRDDLGLIYTLDARISGLARDMVVVAQGQIDRDGDVVRIRREIQDVDFAMVAERGLTRVVDGDVEVYARDLGTAHATLFRRHGTAAIDYFRRWFGPLPYRPVRMVVVSRAAGPGYARRGYVVVAERGGNTPNERGIAGLVAHEFGHAWWYRGGPTTEDYWMTESMASYVSGRYLESIGYGLAPHELAALRRESRETGPILGGGRPSGAAIYTKGPLLLRDLEARIGRPAMDRIIGELARDPPDRTAGFLAKIAEIAGAGAAQAFEADLRRNGYEPPVG